MTSYAITARNTATDSENRMHADDIARQHGFQGGLVPGVIVYGYVATGLAQDPDWISHGSTTVRFRKPCYDGELIEVSLGSDGTIEVRARDEVCVTGRASTGPKADGDALSPDALSPVVVSPRLAPDPGQRPPASAESLAKGTVLRRIPLPTDEEALNTFLTQVSVDDWEHDVVHPGLLLAGANWVLMENVVLPPWIHVESSITHLRAVRIGETVEVHAIVDDEWEHKGHRFVRLNVAWRSGDDVVAVAQHVAIWQPAVVA